MACLRTRFMDTLFNYMYMYIYIIYIYKYTYIHKYIHIFYMYIYCICIYILLFIYLFTIYFCYPFISYSIVYIAVDLYCPFRSINYRYHSIVSHLILVICSITMIIVHSICKKIYIYID